MQLDVVQDRIVLARDFVFDQRSAARAEELPEHRAIIDVTPVIADVRVGGTDIGIAAHALLLVVAARKPQVRRASAASSVYAVLFAAQLEAVRQARKQRASEARDAAIFLAVRFAPADAQHACGRRIHDSVGGDHDAVDLARRGERYRAIVAHVFAHARSVALQRIAETASRGPENRVNVPGLLQEVLLTQLQGNFLAFHGGDVSRHLACGHALENVAASLELVGVGGRGIAAHHARRRWNRVTRRERVLGDRIGAVGDEAGLGGEPATIAPRTPGIDDFLAI